MYYCIYFWMVALFILTPIYFYTLISVSFYIQALYYKMTKDKAHCLSNSLSLFVNMHNKAATNYDIHYCIILSVVNWFII